MSADAAGVPAVELRDVCKKFGATEIIRGVNLVDTARRAPCHHRPQRRRQDHAVQPDLRPLSDQFRLDHGQRPVDRQSGTAGDQPARPVAQFSDHLDLPAHVRVREHPLRAVVVARLPLFVLELAGPAEGAERSGRPIARTAEAFGPAKPAGRPAVLCRAAGAGDRHHHRRRRRDHPARRADRRHEPQRDRHARSR